MNKYYVSVDRGSDANDGLSPATPWKTIGKAIGSSAKAVVSPSGATVYVEPGTYYETVTLSLAPSATMPLVVVGDRDGSAFLAGGYATPKTGLVTWAAWSSDGAVAAATCLTSTNISYVTLKGFKFEGGAGGNATCVNVTGGSAWTFSECALTSFASTTAMISVGSWYLSRGTPLALVVDRCVFVGHPSAWFLYVVATNESVDYDLQSIVRNCLFVGSARGIALSSTPNPAHVGGGFAVENCTFLGAATGVSVYEGIAIDVTPKVNVTGCAFIGAKVAAGKTTQVVEDWNTFCAPSPRTNVTAGANSTTVARPAIDVFDGVFVGVPLRPLGTPTAGSPLLGFASGGPGSVVDLTGRARPEGGGSPNRAAGALERHDTGEPNATYADSGSAACLALKGPSSLERPILVDATPTTISVKVRWDGRHGDANKPRATLLANPEIGVALDQSLTPSSSGGSGSTPNSFETLTFAPVTPTRAGALMLRLESRSATGNGAAYFDSITLS